MKNAKILSQAYQEVAKEIPDIAEKISCSYDNQGININAKSEEGMRLKMCSSFFTMVSPVEREALLAHKLIYCTVLDKPEVKAQKTKLKESKDSLRICCRLKKKNRILENIKRQGVRYANENLEKMMARAEHAADAKIAQTKYGETFFKMMQNCYGRSEETLEQEEKDSAKKRLINMESIFFRKKKERKKALKKMIRKALSYQMG